MKLKTYVFILCAILCGLRVNAADTDFNNDGFTNFADFLTLSGNFGSNNAVHADGDSDFDGDVDFTDFLALSAVFNMEAELHGTWNAAEKKLTVYLVDQTDVKIFEQGGLVKLQDNQSTAEPFGVKDTSNSMGMELNANVVEKLVVHGTEIGDIIDGQEVDSAWSSLQEVTIHGHGGADTIHGTTHDDVIHAGAGDDEIDAGPGHDKIYGDDGDDELLKQPNGQPTFGPYDGSDIFVQGSQGTGKTTYITNRRISQASGDIQCFSSSSNLLATIRQIPDQGFAGDWFIQNLSTQEDLYVGKKAEGDGRNNNLMWLANTDRFLWVDDNVVQLRTAVESSPGAGDAGAVIDNHVLPNDVEGVNAVWFSGDGGGQDFHFIKGRKLAPPITDHFYKASVSGNSLTVTGPFTVATATTAAGSNPPTPLSPLNRIATAVHNARVWVHGVQFEPKAAPTTKVIEATASGWSPPTLTNVAVGDIIEWRVAAGTHGVRFNLGETKAENILQVMEGSVDTYLDENGRAQPPITDRVNGWSGEIRATHASGQGIESTENGGLILKARIKAHSPSHTELNYLSTTDSNMTGSLMLVGDDQRAEMFVRFDGTGGKVVDPESPTGNGWSHPTIDGSRFVVGGHDDDVKIYDINNNVTPTPISIEFKTAISQSRLRTDMGYSEFTGFAHGDLVGTKFIGSFRKSSPNNDSVVAIYDINDSGGTVTATLATKYTGIGGSNNFQNRITPSLSPNHSFAAWHEWPLGLESKAITASIKIVEPDYGP